MKESVYTEKEVSDAIREDFRKKGLSIAEAARKIGKSPQNLTNSLNGKRRFSQASAALLYKEFGYSIDFLRFGKGQLFEGNEDAYYYDTGAQEIVYSLGYVFPKNTKGLTEREKEWNRIVIALREAFFMINNSINIGLTVDINKAIDRQFTRIATTNNERTLEASLLLYAGMLEQLCNVEPILNYLSKYPKE